MFEEGLSIGSSEGNAPEDPKSTQNKNNNNTSIISGLRPLYFAYGSNLSYSQMHQRCIHDPFKSAKPIALARLDRWCWLICQAGYANVVPPGELRVGEQVDTNAPVSGSQDAVFGILYDMTVADEDVLDGYEGVDHASPWAAPNGKIPRSVRPKEQGKGDYNKWYIPATITAWLDEEEERKRQTAAAAGETDVLIYVDERRVLLGPPKAEYIVRMNRAIRESVQLGVPKDWVDSVMRKFILAD